MKLTREQENKLLNIGTLAVFFIIILLLAITLKNNDQCIQDPFTYGADKISNDNGLEVSCSCNFNNPNYAPFYFDKEGIEVPNTAPISSRDLFDFSKLNITSGQG